MGIGGATMIWILVWLIFGLVSIEQSSPWPFAASLVVWVIFSPTQNRLEREAGGNQIGIKLLFMLALAPFLYVILRDMMGVQP